MITSIYGLIHAGFDSPNEPVGPCYTFAEVTDLIYAITFAISGSILAYYSVWVGAVMAFALAGFSFKVVTDNIIALTKVIRIWRDVYDN